MDRLRLKNESGFSLIELFGVVGVIGILATVAIPQFSAYKKQVYEVVLKSDLRNAANAQEAYFAETFAYKSGSLVTGTLEGYNKSNDITAMTATVGTNTFLLAATHVNCTGITWTYSSATKVITGPAC